SDREDGLVTLKWVCNQFWYNGKIGMWGASYIGLTQWAIAFENDGMLQCINPSLTTYHNLWNFRGGLIINELNASIAAILLNTCGQYTVNPDFNAIDKIQFCKRMVTDPTYQMFNEPMESLRYQKVPRLRDFKGMTLGEKEMYLLERTGMILDFANHEFDTFYKLVYRILKKYDINTVAKYMPGNLDMDSAAQINTPIYMVGGWMDLFCEHLLKDYMEIAETAPLELKQNIKMIMGPWAHGAFPFPGVPYYKMLDFARAILPIPYYDYILKDKDTAWKNQAPVRIYVMGRNVWRDEQEWPLSRAIPQKWFLHSGGRANTRSGNGKLSIIEPDDEPADEYDFDPLDPVMTVGGRNLFIQKRSRSQHHPEMRKDVLVYTSDPLPRGVEVTGKVVMTLYASSSAIDTDFMAKLCDVDLKGKSINVLDMGVRARFRTGHPQPLVPGEIFPFEIELGHTSMYFAKGHRIRLDITSSNFPRFDVNSNLGGEQNEKGYAVAHQQVHHTTSYASELVLPVIPD
ncbi:MAG TPA: CocE/NonD family hydrolase, partial [Candidatus Lokiarchaeia archaeon]|nr:CocE/NonD family hydrolase [Candidatus Lokiarchaeia archaeon]